MLSQDEEDEWDKDRPVLVIFCMGGGFPFFRRASAMRTGVSSYASEANDPAMAQPLLREAYPGP